MKRILLTGATGVLGAVLAEEVAQGAHLTCLTRRRQLDLPGVQRITGDLAAPRLGIDSRRFADLVAQTDVVVHCGALTSFGANLATVRAINVAGTNRVLDFTAQADARLVHVSTAFVARIGEFDGPGVENLRSPVSYLRSKVEAESLVLASGLEPVVVRPSVLMGHSRTGRITQFQGWHAMCEAIICERMPFLPASGDALVDSVPVDYVAHAIARLALSSTDPGEWWLTAGQDAFTLDSSIDLCLAVANEYGREPFRPRTLPREMVERLVVPAFGDGAPPALRRQMLEGLELMRLFGSDHRFPSRWPSEHSGRAATHDELVRCFEASLRYLCDRQGLELPAEVAS